MTCLRKNPPECPCVLCDTHECPYEDRVDCFLYEDWLCNDDPDYDE